VAKAGPTSASTSYLPTFGLKMGDLVAVLGHLLHGLLGAGVDLDLRLVAVLGHDQSSTRSVS
jgi:hypothetical protein